MCGRKVKKQQEKKCNMKKEEFYVRNINTNASKERLKAHLWYWVFQYFFRTSPRFLKGWRIFLLRCFGAKIKAKCSVAPTAFISKPWMFEMGYFSSIDDCCYVIPPVMIGDYVAVANNCHIIAAGHNPFSRGFEISRRKITIGDCSFLGAGVYVAPGCSIGTATVVGPHINVCKSIPCNQVMMHTGSKIVTCRRMKDEEFEKYKFNH